MSTDRIPWWVWGVSLAGAGYIVYRIWNGVPKALNTATSAIAQGIANVWLSLPLVGLGSAQQILGNAKLPDGTLVPLNSLIGQIRQDGSNPPNVFANVGGNIYQLSASDAQGNYPATFLAATPLGTTPGGW